MKVAHLSWLLSDAGGGIPPVVLAAAAHQAREAVEARVFGITDPAGPSIDGGGETFRCVGPIALGFSPALARGVARTAPDLLHLHGLFTWPSQVASSWGARTGRPVVVTPHGMLQPWALSNSAWKKRIFRVLVEDRNLRRARCLHALVDAERVNFRRLGLGNPVAVIPNGVVLEDVPVAPDRRALVRTYPELDGRRLLLFLGRIHPKKGLVPLVDAWRTLRDEHALHDWVLLVAGPDEGGHAAVVAERIRAHGLDAEVRVVGPVYGEAKQATLAAADAFVLPSFSEGFSVAVLEAMAWRLPVVITRQCNLDVEAPGAGLLCEPEAGSVAAQLRNLLSLSNEERRVMGAKGRAEVERRYTWPIVADQLIEVYRWLLGGGDRPGTVEAAR